MHWAVMVGEVLDLLEVKRGGTYVDGTAGSGGHTVALLEKVGPEGTVLAIDRDEEAVERTRSRAAEKKGRCLLAHGNYVEMGEIARERGIDAVDGVLLDLGVSSEQLDVAGRGFSFAGDGPLDMRMDRSSGRTAADLVNDLPESELISLIRELGEEPRGRRIAQAIVAARAEAPIVTTTQLSGVIENATGGRRGRLHPATRTFQGLRIAVNKELEVLQAGLSAGLDLLATGGRMAVISFHSLEDRIVKRFFARHAGKWESLAAGGSEWRGELPAVRLVNRKVVVPSRGETVENRRSRSAKLRVAERL